MRCKNVCRECDKKVYSLAVNFDATTNALLVNIPARAYNNNCKYCIVITQPIPATTTINALVFITIDGDTERYPLLQCNCQQLTACNLSSRTRYATVVKTNTVSGVFRLLGNVGCCETTVLPSLPTTTTATAPAVANVAEQPVVFRTVKAKSTAKTTDKGVEE